MGFRARVSKQLLCCAVLCLVDAGRWVEEWKCVCMVMAISVLFGSDFDWGSLCLRLCVCSERESSALGFYANDEGF